MNASEAAYSLRRAAAGDCERIARAHVAAWHETYPGMLAREAIEARTVERRMKNWKSTLNDSTTYVHVVTHREEVVAFASGCAVRESVPGFDGELASIYVLRRAQAHGLGRRLVHAIATDLDAGGFRSVAVFVVAANHGARAFYERLGARPVRTKSGVDIGEAAIDEIVYGWDAIADLLAVSRGSGSGTHRP